MTRSGFRLPIRFDLSVETLFDLAERQTALRVVTGDANSHLCHVGCLSRGRRLGSDALDCLVYP